MGNVNLNSTSTDANSVAERVALKGALNGDLLPRRADGEVEHEGANLGSATVNWNDVFASRIIAGGAVLDVAAAAETHSVFTFTESTTFNWPFDGVDEAVAFIVGGGGGGGGGSGANDNNNVAGGDGTDGADGTASSIAWAGSTINVPGGPGGGGGRHGNVSTTNASHRGHGGAPGGAVITPYRLVSPASVSTVGNFDLVVPIMRSIDSLTPLFRAMGVGENHAGTTLGFIATDKTPQARGGSGYIIANMAAGGDGGARNNGDISGNAGGSGWQYGRWARLSNLTENLTLTITIGAAGAGGVGGALHALTQSNAAPGEGGENGAPGFAILFAVGSAADTT